MLDAGCDESLNFWTALSRDRSGICYLVSAIWYLLSGIWPDGLEKKAGGFRVLDGEGENS